MQYSKYSVVVVGSGAAGMYAALKIANQIELPDGILIVTKSVLGESNSMYAQGGIVGVVHQNPSDSTESHVNDTLKAGAGLSDKNVTQEISEASDAVINDLINMGVPFDRNSEGELTFTLEAAHSVKRILHSGGDATGRKMAESLIRMVKENPEIVVLENTMAVEILVSAQKECKGVIVYNHLTGEHEIIYTSALVLATGGVGQVYKFTTNPDGATGDGIALAYEAGATIQDMEFIQFHPTALALSQENKNRFLISEAVRGEGAKLIDKDGHEFMSKYHDKRELAPRDIVTRAIYSEMKKDNTPNMFLKTSVINSEKLMERFPTIFKVCASNGIDISVNPIPVAPAAHYTMGGVKAAVSGKTSIKGLYAIGETASTGLHGANRLASNSLLECVVCAYGLADYLSFANLETPNIIDNGIKKMIDVYSRSISDDGYDIPALKNKLRSIMWNNVGIIRTEEGLLNAQMEVEQLKRDFKRKRKCFNKSEYEYRNMLISASLIIEGALARKESRGAHSRADYKQTDAIARHTELTKNSHKESLEYVS